MLSGEEVTNHSCYKVGIGYDFQVINEVPIEKHDVSLDLIVTEKRIY